MDCAKEILYDYTFNRRVAAQTKIIISQVSQNDCKYLWEIASLNKSKSWRALWLLEKTLIHFPEYLINHEQFNRAEAMFLASQDNSKLRHLLKLMLMDFKADMNGRTADKCFKIITNPLIDAAVRVHAIQLLYKLSISFPELHNELEQSLLPIIENESKPSILIRSRKVLQKIYGNKKANT